MQRSLPVISFVNETGPTRPWLSVSPSSSVKRFGSGVILEFGESHELISPPKGKKKKQSTLRKKKRKEATVVKQRIACVSSGHQDMSVIFRACARRYILFFAKFSARKPWCALSRPLCVQIKESHETNCLYRFNAFASWSGQPFIRNQNY